MANRTLAEIFASLTKSPVDEEALEYADRSFYAIYKDAPNPLPGEDEQGYNEDLVGEWMTFYVEKCSRHKREEAGRDTSNTVDHVEEACDVLEPHVHLCDGKRPVYLQVILHNVKAKEIETLPQEPSDRVEHLIRVLKDAYELRHELPHPDQTLTLFVAPELYIARRPQSNTAWRYTHVEAEITCKKLTEISTAFPRMLIVPGSIGWFEPPLEPCEDYERLIPTLARAKKKRIHNSTRVVMEGREFDYHKKVDIDLDYGANDQVFDIPKGKHGVFEASQMMWGIGICGDSNLLREDYGKLFSNGPGVDVHILIAQGQDLSKEILAAKQGGYAIRLDAEGAGAAELHRVDRKAADLFLSSSATFAETLVGQVHGDGGRRLIVYPPVLCPIR